MLSWFYENSPPDRAHLNAATGKCWNLMLEIIRDDQRIERLRRISHVTRFVGLGVLLVGMILAFRGDPQWFTWELIALLVGWILSQVAVYLDHRYVRLPRPDQQLDDEIKKAGIRGRLYHYVLSPSHVLLTPAGLIVLVVKYQGGKVSVQGEKWQQKGLGLRRFFGQEGLGNPSRDAAQQLNATAQFLKKQATQLEEVPVGVVIVFTNPGVELNVQNPTLPVIHIKKLKGFLKQNQGQPLAAADYHALRDALDAQAGPVAAG